MSGGGAGVPPGWGQGAPPSGGAHYANDSDDDHDDDDSSKDGSLKGGAGSADLNGSGGGSDAEGVWSPDIEQSFQEALAIYPPCGRRKIILSDEGKMYGRNELIARYIKLRTGKTRTRKQVSSHIQVLARRKAREIQAKLKVSSDQSAKEAALQSMSSMSSAQIVSLFYSSQDQAAKEKALQSLTSSQIAALQNKAAAAHHAHHHAATHVAAAAAGLATLGLTAPPPVTPYTSPAFWQPAGPTTGEDIKPFSGGPQYANVNNNNINPSGPAWEGRSIATHKLRLVEFTAFMEPPNAASNNENNSQNSNGDNGNRHLFVHIGCVSPIHSDPLLEPVDIRQIYDKFPEKKGGLKELYDKGPQNAFFLVKFWADLNTSPLADESGAFYGVSSQYESNENMTITCSTKVCSFGKQVVEKVETEYARFENGRFIYRIYRSPMCEYMINFIHKLKHLPEKYMMNSVLENFTILQVVTNRDTQETLLCMAYVFEVSANDHGTQHHIYRLVKD